MCRCVLDLLRVSLSKLEGHVGGQCSNQGGVITTACTRSYVACRGIVLFSACRKESLDAITSPNHHHELWISSLQSCQVKVKYTEYVLHIWGLLKYNSEPFKNNLSRPKFYTSYKIFTLHNNTSTDGTTIKLSKYINCVSAIKKKQQILLKQDYKTGWENSYYFIFYFL